MLVGNMQTMDVEPPIDPDKLEEYIKNDYTRVCLAACKAFDRDGAYPPTILAYTPAKFSQLNLPEMPNVDNPIGLICSIMQHMARDPKVAGYVYAMDSVQSTDPEGKNVVNRALVTILTTRGGYSRMSEVDIVENSGNAQTAGDIRYHAVNESSNVSEFLRVWNPNYNFGSIIADLSRAEDLTEKGRQLKGTVPWLDKNIQN
jgi:hypothetical protein